ncbi:MAG: Gfo/Idh/MocA family protein [Thermoplasmatota archaeon]
MTLKVAVVGCGGAANERHIPAWRRAGAKVAAVYDRDPERARKAARRAGATPWTDLEAMLEEGATDVASVCSPPPMHAAHATAALARGNHVFLEKPMAMDLAECTAIQHAERRHGRSVCVSHNFLESRAVARVRRDVDAGGLGEVESFLGFQMSHPRRRLPTWFEGLPGGLYFDEAPHHVYLARHFLGALEVAHAHAREGQGPQRTRQVVATVRGTRADGQLQHLFHASRAEWGFLLVGSRRSWLVDMYRDAALPMGKGGGHAPREVLWQSVAGLASASAAVVGAGARHATGRISYGHDRLVRRFSESVAAGGPPPVDSAQGAECIRIISEICDRAGLRALARPGAARST